MTIGPITITLDKQMAGELEKVIERTHRTPEDVTLEALTEFLERISSEPSEDAAYAHIEGVLVDNTGIEKKDWSAIAGVFSGGDPTSAARLEEILEEEWLRDEN